MVRRPILIYQCSARLVISADQYLYRSRAYLCIHVQYYAQYCPRSGRSTGFLPSPTTLRIRQLANRTSRPGGVIFTFSNRPEAPRLLSTHYRVRANQFNIIRVSQKKNNNNNNTLETCRKKPGNIVDGRPEQGRPTGEQIRRKRRPLFL